MNFLGKELERAWGKRGKAQCHRLKHYDALPIFEIRGCRVLLDSDLARIYGIETRKFNQAVKRNRDRFPADFAFQLTADEYRGLALGADDSSTPLEIEPQGDGDLRSQIVISSGHGARRFYDNQDSRAKRAVGAVWESRSGGKCRFIMPRHTPFEID